MIDKKLLTIVVPVYNEEKTIEKVLLSLTKLREKIEKIEIIVVNDGSKDNSLKILKENHNYYDVLINNVQNKGKGNAVKSALEKANGKYIVFQDADLEYDPQDFNKFVNLINKFSPDLIIGSRFNYADYTRSHHFFNKIGNMCITFIFNLFYQTTFTDVYSCYACFKRELLDHHNLKSNGFDQHAEILCKVVKKGKTFYEVPINYNGRTHEEGKKIKFYHIFSVIYQIVIGRFI
jgi:glycosyltransferase involved in cell wall biosynthesis